VLPLDDRSAVELLTIERPNPEPPRTRYVYYPDTEPVPEGVAVNIRGRNYKIIADVDITNQSNGVLFAHGSRFGGHALFIKNKKLCYSYNFLGIEEQKFVSNEELPTGKHSIGMEFIREKAGKYGESIGTTKLYIDDKTVGEGPMKAQVGKFTLSGDGLCIGYDSGDNVSQDYKNPGTFTGGTILGVGVDVGKDVYLDMEKEAAAAFALD
jgi:arylsulfatase